ncbi:uncharacterized protein [Rutidosis leptorrhynchoides]|uniref:uncharacterized protein n=1 Tax=Rutidosis leptorrhynchoides TaxID=125765 RepID=UPI003A9A0C94
MGSVAVVTFKTLFTILACVKTTALLYGLIMDGFSSCFDSRARWMQVALTDVIIDICLIGVWFGYKESNWIYGVLFTCLLFWIGSSSSCHMKNVPKIPCTLFLLDIKKRSVMEQTRGVSIVTARVLVTILGCFLPGFLVYALVVDGLPFRGEVLSP